MLNKFLKRLTNDFFVNLFGSTEEVEVIDDTVVQEAVDGDDAIMKNALLAMETGKIVYGDFEDGVLTSHVSQADDD